MTEQELDKIIKIVEGLSRAQFDTSQKISAINSTLQALDKMSNQLEKFNNKFSEMEDKRLKEYNEFGKDSSLWTGFVLFVLLTIIGIWGLHFHWFVGVSFGLALTGIIVAFYFKVRL